MPTPAEIMDAVGSLMNDTAQTVYTDVAVLPYLNMALDMLQEIFEENNIPSTNNTSAIITVPAGTTFIGYSTTPALPAGLIEIQRLWQSPSGSNQFTPVNPLTSLPEYLIGIENSQITTWSWANNGINLPDDITANIDLKLDYIQKIFSTPIVIGDIGVDLPYQNVKVYLEFKTAALCAMFIAENENRAMILENQALEALNRSLGISTKGRQSIPIRRRPFRANFKARGW